MKLYEEYIDELSLKSYDRIMEDLAATDLRICLKPMIIGMINFIEQQQDIRSKKEGRSILSNLLTYYKEPVENERQITKYIKILRNDYNVDL